MLARWDVKLRTTVFFQHGLTLFLWITFFLDMPRWHLDYMFFGGQNQLKTLFPKNITFCLDFASRNFEVLLLVIFSRSRLTEVITVPVEKIAMSPELLIFPLIPH